MPEKVIPSPLPGFDAEEVIARDIGCNPVTLARARKRGEFEYIDFAGRIFDKREGPHSVDAYLRSQIKRRNPPPRTSRRGNRSPAQQHRSLGGSGSRA